MAKADRTAIFLVNGYNGLGLHSALHVPRLFGHTFKNFVFLSVGAVDAGNCKGADELAALRAHTAAEAERYAASARAHGYAPPRSLPSARHHRGTSPPRRHRPWKISEQRLFRRPTPFLP